MTNLNAFFVVLAFGYLIHGSTAIVGVARTADITFISQLKGQFHDNPILGLSFALCLFSMAGIPPLVGFFAKYSVLYSAIENGYYFLALVGILASVISAAYYLRIIRVIHFDSENGVHKKSNQMLHDGSVTKESRSDTSGIRDQNLEISHFFPIQKGSE